MSMGFVVTFTNNIHLNSPSDIYRTRRKTALVEKAQLIREAEMKCAETLRLLEEEYLERREEIMMVG